MICDGSFPTSMLTHWTRDRSRGPKFPLEWIVKRQTADTAHWIGLHDRGLIAPGYRADLNIIDYDGLTLHRPVILRDLPANGRRLMQRATPCASAPPLGPQHMMASSLHDGQFA